MISLHEFNTGILYNDGTAAVIGDNQYGQCIIKKNKNIKQISIGASRTGLLFDNNKVIIFGNNGNGECDISKEQNKNIKTLILG